METLLISATVVLIAVLLTRLSYKSRKIKRLEDENEILIEMTAEEYLIKINNNMEQLKVDVHDIKGELFTNEKTGRPGLVERHDTLSKKVEELSDSVVTKKQILGWGVGIGTFASGATHFVKELFSFFK